MSEKARDALRKEKIKNREGLPVHTRREQSLKIVERIAASRIFQRAETVMIYRGIGGEVKLEALMTDERSKGKQFLFPLCLPRRQMSALCPQGDEGWQPGSFGILEPVPEKSVVVQPEDIDLIICPCTVFDEDCNRMGMGGGYYDRFLPRCRKAVVAAAAFEVQKAPSVPMEPWDRPLDMVFTEEKVYSKK